MSEKQKKAIFHDLQRDSNVPLDGNAIQPLEGKARISDDEQATAEFRLRKLIRRPAPDLLFVEADDGGLLLDITNGGVVLAVSWEQEQGDWHQTEQAMRHVLKMTRSQRQGPDPRIGTLVLEEVTLAELSQYGEELAQSRKEKVRPIDTYGEQRACEDLCLGLRDLGGIDPGQAAHAPSLAAVAMVWRCAPISIDIPGNKSGHADVEGDY